MRKWLLPGLANPLLIVRDPVAILVWWLALRTGRWRRDLWTISLLFIGVASFLLTLALGIGPVTALFGLRAVCLHFPLVFIFARVLNREDVLRLGTFFLALALPMAVLMVLQFQAGSEAIISKGVGAELGGQLSGGEGRIRPPGVFSFTISIPHYYSLCLAFLLHRFATEERRATLRLIVPSLGVALATAVAISRALVASLILVGVVFVLSAIRMGVPFRKYAALLLTGAILAGFWTYSNIAREGASAYDNRWQEAGDTTGTFLGRALDMFSVGGDAYAQAGIVGKGLGLGTNVGARLATGERDFLLAESEWPRIVLEMGVVLGTAFIAWRVALVLKLGKIAVAAWTRQDMLPALLFSAAAIPLLTGQTGVPAVLGYAVISAGIAFAAGQPPQGEPLGAQARRREMRAPPSRAGVWPPRRPTRPRI